MAKFNRDEIDIFHDYGVYVPDRTVYMGSELVSETDDFAESGTEAKMVERFIKNMHFLESLSNEAITIIMNNPGGDHYSGMAIYDAIKASKAHTTIKVFGQAFSMGSLILQAANKRILAPNSRIMIHYGTQGTGEVHTKDFKQLADESEKLDTLIEDIYLQKINKKRPISRQELQKILMVDTYLSPKEAVEMGLADKILGEDDV